MRIFCISDIHGNLKAFEDVLQQVNFNAKQDCLYILGDMIDCGCESVPLLLRIKEMSEENPDNIRVLLGNHELLMLSTLIYNNSYASYCWTANRGTETMEQFFRLSAVQKLQLLQWLKGLPVSIETEDYIFTHSTIAYEPREMDNNLRIMFMDWNYSVVHKIWKRVVPSELGKYTNKILVSGHTITHEYHDSYDIYFDLQNGYINIDCGAKCLGKSKYKGDYKLGVLELSTLEDKRDTMGYRTYYSKKY